MQLVRALQILRDLDRLGGVDLYELAERHGTTVRTIRRDLDALEQAGLPLVEQREGKRKRWQVAFKAHLQKLTTLLDASHYLALRVAMGQGGAVRKNASVFAALEDLSHKIETAIGPAGRSQLATIEACFHSYEKFPYRSSPPDVLWPLVQAIAGRRVCRVTYRAPRKDRPETSYEVLPLRLFVHNGAAYLWCHGLRHDRLLKLNLQRVQSLKLLARHAEPPVGFDPEALENATFGIDSGGSPTSYVLRFDPDVAPYIRERSWHPSQKLRELKDSGVELRFTCSESYEVSSWVASWRQGVKVIRPTSLRSELHDLGGWLSATYSARGRSAARRSRRHPSR
jgi:predicted DNA-binding transcriptional regulator YafY